MSHIEDPPQDAGAQDDETPEEFAEELESDPSHNPEDEELKDIQGG
jgi:hypothetical protein